MTNAQKDVNSADELLALYANMKEYKDLQDESVLMHHEVYAPSPPRKLINGPLRLTPASRATSVKSDLVHGGERTRLLPQSNSPAGRRPSLSCVSLDAATELGEGFNLATPARCRRQHDSKEVVVPPLQPPNQTCSADVSAVNERTTFLFNTRYNPPKKATRFAVHLHVYDLSRGMTHKYSKELFGTQIHGVYHSGIACFGLEFYFEGGIGISASGCSRFGSKYHAIELGTTTKSLPEFLEWVRMSGLIHYQLHQYHLTNSNCHHFTNRAAEYLLGKVDLIPSYLFQNVENLISTPQGLAVKDSIQLTTMGIQSAVARWMRTRVKERLGSYDIMLQAATACGVLMVPPTVGIVFRIDDKKTANKTIVKVLPVLRNLIASGLVKPAAEPLIEYLLEELLTGRDTIAPAGVAAFLDVIAEGLIRSPLTLWGPLLNALRVAILHHVVLITCAFRPRLMSLLVLGMTDYPRLLPDGKLALLRLACNFASCSHGAIVMTDRRYQGAWVSLVGLALTDKHPAILYAASCLAVNIVTAVVITTMPSLKREMRFTENQVTLRLATIILYTLRHRLDHLCEPSLNMLLLAIFRIMSSNSVAIEFITSHSYSLQYVELLHRSRSNESRALVCLLKTMHEIFG